MKSNKLIIIGNGFDLDHNLETKYSDFYEYLEYGEGAELGGRGLSDNINQLSTTASEFFWNDFEKNLGEITTDVILENALEQRRNFNNGFDYEILNNETMLDYINNNFFSSLYLLDELVKSWIETVELHATNPKDKYSHIFNDNSCYLTFNYTKVLEEVYDITSNRVIHIHGSVDDEPIMGHGEDLIEVYQVDDNEIDYLSEQYKASISTWLTEFYNSSRKKTDILVSELAKWFDQLDKRFDQVYILGHSLGEVDYIYFEYLFERLEIAEWFISFYNESDKERKRRHIEKMKTYNRTIKFFDPIQIGIDL